MLLILAYYLARLTLSFRTFCIVFLCCFPGEWAVTVAGSCPAALPNDVEMRLRFPDPGRTHSHTHTHEHTHARAPPVCPRAVSILFFLLYIDNHNPCF